MTETMRAVVLHEHGEIDGLTLEENHPRPQATPGFAVVKVRATSLNYHDIFTVKGMPGITVPMPIVPGLDVVGEVSELGEGVTGWNVGDRVLVNPLRETGELMGEMVDGGLAQYALVAAEQLIAIPDAVTFEQAAALPVAYGTAHRMVVGKGKVSAGDRVLVLGASGGVGTAAVLLAKQLGAWVVAAVGSEEKAQRMRELGADDVINYKEQDFYAWTKEHLGKPNRFTSDTGFDVIVNFTGGDTWKPTLKSTALGGRILVCGATAGFDPVEDLRYIWTFELQIIGSNGFGREDFVALLDDVAAGKLAPVVDEVLPLDRAAEGLAKVRDRGVVGKVVVDPWLESGQESAAGTQANQEPAAATTPATA
ncbi:zinc-binding dehydrogenase [Georgenia sp. Z1344]|uniref:zinc-binding dehydrogenase n=1 Tax=Georgenia sp. Z1344 TaxID=3416706 RepID=UPI003CF11093